MGSTLIQCKTLYGCQKQTQADVVLWANVATQGISFYFLKLFPGTLCGYFLIGGNSRSRIFAPWQYGICRVWCSQDRIGNVSVAEDILLQEVSFSVSVFQDRTALCATGSGQVHWDLSVWLLRVCDGSDCVNDLSMWWIWACEWSECVMDLSERMIWVCWSECGIWVYDWFECVIDLSVWSECVDLSILYDFSECVTDLCITELELSYSSFDQSRLNRLLILLEQLIITIKNKLVIWIHNLVYIY